MNEIVSLYGGLWNFLALGAFASAMVFYVDWRIEGRVTVATVVVAFVAFVASPVVLLLGLVALLKAKGGYELYSKEKSE